MCGRYVLIDGKRVLATFPMLQQAKVTQESWKALPQYNAAPMQRMPVIIVRDGEMRVEPMQWWLVPHWAKEPKTDFSTFNAKAETIRQSKLFGTYFKGSRCLVPADAFYEWKKVIRERPEKGLKSSGVEKHPMCIRMTNEKPFMMAGLFSVWKSEDGTKEMPTFTIITTSPNKLLETIHNRMPVILKEKDHERWIDRDYHDVDDLASLLEPYPDAEMKAYRVSRMVSSAKNNSAECLKPSST